MDSELIQVKMLGELSLSLGGETITDSDNRSKKVWLLLAYMIYCRNRTVSQEDLIRLLWGDEERSSNPLNALKTMFHRVRTTLDQLGNSAGHRLIVRQGGSYAWNTAVPLSLDVDVFEALCRAGAAADGGEETLARYREALALYQGDFLPRLASEPWVVPIAAYFHNLYVETVLETIPLLEEREQWAEAADVCRSAIGQEPYREPLYQHLMRCLLQLNDCAGAITVYEEMSDLLLANFGVMPEEDSRKLYREALRTVNDRAVSLGTVQAQLREPDGPAGALLCEYDFFKVLYHAEARAVARSGNAVHIALLSVRGQRDGVLSKRSLDRAMENLREMIRSNLRRGDIAARCSVSQYILMLPQANYENSCMVCERILRAFARQYPHSPAVLHYSVQPLEPNV